MVHACVILKKHPNTFMFRHGGWKLHISCLFLTTGEMLTCTHGFMDNTMSEMGATTSVHVSGILFRIGIVLAGEIFDPGHSPGYRK